MIEARLDLVGIPYPADGTLLVRSTQRARICSGTAESPRELATEIGDEHAQRRDGTGWVGVWRRTIALELALACLREMRSVGVEHAPIRDEHTLPGRC